MAKCPILSAKGDFRDCLGKECAWFFIDVGCAIPATLLTLVKVDQKIDQINTKTQQQSSPYSKKPYFGA